MLNNSATFFGPKLGQFSFQRTKNKTRFHQFLST